MYLFLLLYSTVQKVLPSHDVIMNDFGCQINSLVPGKCGNDLKRVIFKHMLQMKFMSISSEIAPRLILPDLTDNKSTLVQVRAWCRRATSHYQSQC